MSSLDNRPLVRYKTTLKTLRRSLFLVSAPMVFITFALPLRAEDLGASAVEIGLLYSLFTVSVFFIRPLAGVGLDIFGRKPFFVAATGFYFAANVFYALSETIETLFIGRLLQGFGFAVLAIATDTITSDVADPDARSAAMGGNIASQTRGGMAGAFIGFSFVGAMPVYAWVFSFWVFSAVSVLAIIFAIVALPETRPAASKEQAREKFTTPDGYGKVLVIIFAAALAGALIQPFYLIYLRERFDLELYMLATAFLPIGVAYAVLPSLLGRLSDKFHRASAIVAGLVLSGAFYAVVPTIGPFVWIIGAFLAAAIGGVIIDMTKNAWIADLSAHGMAGRTFGLAAFAAGAGAAAGPLIGGVIYDALGPDYLFYNAALILFAAAFLAAAMRPKRVRSDRVRKN